MSILKKDSAHGESAKSKTTLKYRSFFCIFNKYNNKQSNNKLNSDSSVVQCTELLNKMTIFHLNDLPKEKRIQMIGEFYDVIDSLKDRSEIRFFFKSLLTADEIATLMRRVEIAILLHSKFTYDQIVDILGVGRAKVASVHKCLLQDDSGYKIIVERLIKNRKDRLKRIKNEEKQARESETFLGNIKRAKVGARILPDLLDAVIEKLEDDKELEKEAVLYTPSAVGFKKSKNK